MQGVKLREKAIREHVGEQNLLLGKDYAQRGAIFDQRRQKDRIKARCEGSREEPYRLWARLEPQGSVVESACSCPMSTRCKHIAALLLVWRLHPEEFIALEAVEDVLVQKTKEELMELIQKMLSQAPELESFLEIPKKDENVFNEKSEREGFRRQATAIFRRFLGRPNGQEAAAQALGALLDVARERLEKNDPEGASAVLCALLSEVILQEDALDEGGALTLFAVDCVSGVGRALGQLSEPEARREILTVLFEVYRFDIDAGGVTLGDEIPGLLVRLTRPEERALVCSWLREALQSAREWGRKQYGDLLLSLERGRLDDEAFLQLCRELGNNVELAARLAALGRHEALKALIAQISAQEALSLLDFLVGQKEPSLAEALVSERLAKQPEPVLAQWLSQHKTRAKDALLAARERFWAKPTLPAYRELRSVAKATARWDETRAALYTQLQRENPDILRQLYLEEGLFEEALSLLSPLQSSEFLECYPHLLTAEAAEHTHPKISLQIYQRYIELQLQTHSLAGYKEACRFLQKVKKLFEDQHQEAAWLEYLGALRQQNTGQRAFELELSEARLLP